MESDRRRESERRERRRYRRRPASLRVYTFEQDDPRERLSDISPGGARFESPHLFCPHDYVCLKLIAPERAGTTPGCSVLGRVVWSDKVKDEAGIRYVYGVDFAFIEQPSGAHAQHVLAELLGGDALDVASCSASRRPG